MLAFEVGEMARADVTVVRLVWSPWMVTRYTSDVRRIDDLRKTKRVQHSDTDADVGDLSRDSHSAKTNKQLDCCGVQGDDKVRERQLWCKFDCVEMFFSAPSGEQAFGFSPEATLKQMSTTRASSRTATVVRRSSWTNFALVWKRAAA